MNDNVPDWIKSAATEIEEITGNLAISNDGIDADFVAEIITKHASSITKATNQVTEDPPVKLDLVRARSYAESLREWSTKVATVGESMAFMTYASHMEVMADRIEKLDELIRHCLVHSGYKDCGRTQMTTEQKSLYEEVIGQTPGYYNPD